MGGFMPMVLLWGTSCYNVHFITGFREHRDRVVQSQEGSFWQQRELCLCHLSESNSPGVSALANDFQGSGTIVMKKESLEMVKIS